MVGTEPRKFSIKQLGNAERTNPPPGSLATKPSLYQSKPKPSVRYIVVLGPQGSGKSSFINAACGEQVREVSVEPELCTTGFSYRSLVMDMIEFRLIDSPGFDNTKMSDVDIFTKFLQYLSNPQRAPTPRKLAGVLYIHPEGDNLGSGTLKRNLHTLETLLGESYLTRLTIITISLSSEMDRAAFTNHLLHQKSPFSDLRSKGAKLQVSELDTVPIREILLGYASLKPELFLAQHDMLHGEIADLKLYVEACLQRTETKSIDARIAKTHSSQEEEAQRVKIALADAVSERKKLNTAVIDYKTEADELYSQLQQTRAEYASLRSQLQVKENVEQSQIVQTLVDLNRQVEDLGRAVSAYLVDTYPDASVSSLSAFRLLEVQKMFEHKDGKSSLVLSSNGAGMLGEDFFDHAIRAILCEQLYRRIFLPFHPKMAVSDPRNAFTNSVYRQIRLRESQAVSGRWRTTFFNAISQENDTSTALQYTTKLAREILDENINPLLKNFFDPAKNVALAKQHTKRLHELVLLALDWNRLLKGNVVLLGDFQPIAHRHGSPFRPEFMSVFEPKRGGRDPDNILSTIGLGLVLSRAQGEEKEPEQTVLCKALVASEALFDQDS